jgi:hypothetical protein
MAFSINKNVVHIQYKWKTEYNRFWILVQDFADFGAVKLCDHIRTPL